MRPVSFLMTLSLILLPVLSVAAESAAKPATETEQVNYSIGYQLGSDFKKQGWQINPEVMVQGIQDAINGTQPRLSEEQMKATLIEMKRKLVLAQQQAAIDYQRASAEFMKANAAKEGVVALPSGVQYKVLKEGTGKKPTPEDTVRIHFKLFKVDGTEVGSTYASGDPRVVSLSAAMPGLQEVICLMKEGARYQIVLPQGMAASNREKDDSGASIYELELISIKPKA